MTRAYALLASLILIASPLAGCLTGEDIEDIEDIEEIIDDILGCMDENAENYAENATAELLGDCIYLASMEIFITAMTEQMEIDEMLEIIPRAGYSMTITTSEWNTDMNMQMDTVIEEMVMADLDTNSVYVKNSISIVPYLTYEFTQIQVGELVNVHYTMGGMLAAENAGMGSYQTRDADPDVMDVISSLVSVSDAGDTGEEIGLDLPTGDLSDLLSEMPADTEPVITFEDETGVHTMTLDYTNDTGHDISIVILIDENEDLMSYEISTDYGSRNAPGSASSSIVYTAMWGDAVVIEVDDTLPRTSIPINFHVEGMPEDDGGDDTFYCDNGNEIPMDSVDDGWDDCGDGSDESGDGGDDEVVFVCDNGEEISFGWVNDGYPDCLDESDEATYDEADGEEPNFADTLSCMPYVDSSIVGDEDPSELWDGTNLDMTECDGEPSEYYTDYVIGDTPDTSLYYLTAWHEAEDWSMETGDSTGEMCEEWYDGSYDADNDVCSMVFELARNDTHILWPEGDWDANNDDPDGDMCEDDEGSYDADEDICWFADAEIVDADGGALVIDWGDGDEYQFYQHDSTTGSGVLIEIKSSFICDDGESVDSESYDDGWEDCEDGSDEPDQGEETSEFECMDGTVIPFSWVNDWEDDCPDGSDEQWYYEGSGDDDEGPPTPEEAMYVTDTNGDDNMSLDEFVDFWNSDNPDAQIDSDNSFLTTSDVSDLIEMCDYDENEMIDINEMQCFIDNLMDMIPDGDDASADDVFEWMNADGDGQVTPSEWADFANTTGDIIDGDDFDNLNYMMDMYDYDESGGLDMYEFAELWDEINDDDDDGGDGDGEDDSPFRVTMMVIDQTLNAPISDFEVRFLVDCGEPDEEGNEPPISNCTVVASNGLTEGFATVDPEITEYEFTYQYLDLDGDGLISDMDTLVIDNLMPDVRVELYDTWADQYTSDSYATSQVPGFGALMAVVVLLGAAFATRRD